jgi:hypothetical protein
MLIVLNSNLDSTTDLREEDYSDKPHPYIEKLLGNASHHPIEKVRRYLEPSFAVHPLPPPLLWQVLKLICLQSSASNGLRARLLEQYKRAVLHAYGYQHLNTLLQLEKAGLVRARSQEEKGGLLRAQETRGFPALRKQLQLVAHGNLVDDRNPSPSSMTYLFSGYAPLSVRLVEVLSRKQGFAAFEEATRQLPGPPAFMMTQLGRQSQKRNTVGNMVLVFFIGGVTLAEISALRYLTNREDSVMEYAIGATHVTNGPALVSSVMGDTPLYHASRSLWENITDSGRARTPPSSSAPPPSHRAS